MDAQAFFDTCQRKGIELRLRGGKVQAFGTVPNPETFTAQLKRHKEQIIALLKVKPVEVGLDALPSVDTPPIVGNPMTGETVGKSHVRRACGAAPEFARVRDIPTGEKLAEVGEKKEGESWTNWQAWQETITREAHQWQGKPITRARAMLLLDAEGFQQGGLTPAQVLTIRLHNEARGVWQTPEEVTEALNRQGLRGSRGVSLPPAHWRLFNEWRRVRSIEREVRAGRDLEQFRGEIADPFEGAE
jgi:hypothetical protein